MATRRRDVELHAPTGPDLSCTGGVEKAALRMPLNNRDPMVAEDQRAPVVHGAISRAALRLERVRVNDSGTGVMRHADAGDVRAAEVARKRGSDLPMLDP